MYLLGIDLGTTGCKSMVFSQEGVILGSSYIEYDLIIGQEGYIEQSADIWWENIRKSVKIAVETSGIDGKSILALSVSSQGISFVPVDKNGNPLMNAISWLDGRAVDEAEAIRTDYSDADCLAIMGKTILPTYVMPKLIWLKKHRSEIYKKTWKFMMGHDYLLYKFTGKAVTDYSMASGTLAYNITDKVWFDDILERFGIDKEKLPTLGCLGDVIGHLFPDVAEDLGLSTGTLVVMGAQDQRCASIGAGIDKGILTVSLGTATAICSICSEPLIDNNLKVTCWDVDKNYWMLQSAIYTSGLALKWVKNSFYSTISYKEMDELALSSPAGSNGTMFFPHLGYDGGGAHGAFTGISLHTTQSDIIRSVLEGIAFQIQIHIQSHEAINGFMHQIRLFGGGATSRVWAQIIADITGKTVIIPRTHETGNLGAAIIAGIGAGLYTSFHDAHAMIGTPSGSYKTNPLLNENYSSLFQKYCHMNEKIL